MLPYISIGLCALGFIVYMIYTKILQPKHNRKTDEEEKNSANLEINVKDIGNNEIFTLDGKVISIFKLAPINTDLITSSEKKTLVDILTGELSAIKRPFKIISLPRPFDIAPFIETLTEQKKAANDIQKQIITNEISELYELVSTGSIVQRHFYVLIWDNVSDDYTKNRNEFMVHWKDGKVDISLLEQQEIVRLLNLIFNPSYSVDDDEELTPTIPTIQY